MKNVKLVLRDNPRECEILAPSGERIDGVYEIEITARHCEPTVAKITLRVDVDAELSPEQVELFRRVRLNDVEKEGNIGDHVDSHE